MTTNSNNPYADLPELFRPLDPNNPEAPSYLGGAHEEPERLAASFLLAADIHADVWRDSREHGREAPIVLPILQTYRHALELLLKAGCMRIAALQRRSLEMGWGSFTEPAALEDVLGHTHGIGDLVDLLTQLMDGLDVDKQTSQLPLEVRETLGFLHAQDAKGQAFRYGTHQASRKPSIWKPLRPEQTEVYADSAFTRLSDAAHLLADGLGGYLDAYEAILNEQYAEWQANMRSYSGGY